MSDTQTEIIMEKKDDNNNNNNSYIWTNGTFAIPVEVYGSLAAQQSAFQGHRSPLTCSSILPTSPGYDPEGNTARH